MQTPTTSHLPSLFSIRAAVPVGSSGTGSWVSSGAAMMVNAAGLAVSMGALSAVANPVSGNWAGVSVTIQMSAATSVMTSVWSCPAALDG